MMAITTLDGALAGMQWTRPFAKNVTGTMVAGRPWSLWALAGNPGAGTYNTTLTGVALSSTGSQVTGQINFTTPAGGVNAYLARFQGCATIAGTLLLCDRLWSNGGFTITTTTAQTVNSGEFPARDVDGLTAGKGILVGIEISSAAGAAAPAPTLQYTNSDGLTGRSASLWFPTANSPAAGSFFPFGLSAGDVGVRSIQSLTLGTSWVSGTMNLVAYRVLATLELTGAFVPNALDAITGGFQRLYDGTVPYLIFIPSTTTTSNISGSVTYTHG